MSETRFDYNPLGTLNIKWGRDRDGREEQIRTWSLTCFEGSFT